MMDQDEMRMAAAHDDGVHSGLDLDQQAADNPFGHDQIMLRSAWLLGFATGRTKLGELTGGKPPTQEL
ncbi:hypothetical protein [Sphingomonas swuensis]|uniref:hypothetical protein n=1 Tax=Sphingomonas swuensis TaxID=977800 RepID=UPI0031DAD5B9